MWMIKVCRLMPFELKISSMTLFWSFACLTCRYWHSVCWFRVWLSTPNFRIDVFQSDNPHRYFPVLYFWVEWVHSPQWYGCCLDEDRITEGKADEFPSRLSDALDADNVVFPFLRILLQIDNRAREGAFNRNIPSTDWMELSLRLMVSRWEKCMWVS